MHFLFFLATLEILVPEPEVVATSELKVDGKNPNRMSREQHERLKTSIKKFGFIVPHIIPALYLYLNCYGFKLFQDIAENY
jgi:hypothetical protein